MKSDSWDILIHDVWSFLWAPTFWLNPDSRAVVQSSLCQHFHSHVQVYRTWEVVFHLNYQPSAWFASTFVDSSDLYVSWSWASPFVFLCGCLKRKHLQRNEQRKPKFAESRWEKTYNQIVPLFQVYRLFFDPNRVKPIFSPVWPLLGGLWDLNS